MPRTKTDAFPSTRSESFARNDVSFVARFSINASAFKFSPLINYISPILAFRSFVLFVHERSPSLCISRSIRILPPRINKIPPKIESKLIFNATRGKSVRSRLKRRRGDIRSSCSCPLCVRYIMHINLISCWPGTRSIRACGVATDRRKTWFCSTIVEMTNERKDIVFCRSVEHRLWDRKGFDNFRIVIRNSLRICHS